MIEIKSASFRDAPPMANGNSENYANVGANAIKRIEWDEERAVLWITIEGFEERAMVPLTNVIGMKEMLKDEISRRFKPGAKKGSTEQAALAE